MAQLNKGIILSTLQTALTLIKAYIDDRASTLSSAILDLDKAVDEKLPLTGGTLTGNLSGKYITGTWLKTTGNSNGTGNFVTQNGGWLYYRTPAETRGDIDAPSTTGSGASGT